MHQRVSSPKNWYTLKAMPMVEILSYIRLTKLKSWLACEWPYWKNKKGSKVTVFACLRRLGEEPEIKPISLECLLKRDTRMTRHTLFTTTPTGKCILVIFGIGLKLNTALKN